MYENHIFGVANVSSVIADFLPNLDSQSIYVCALLHDYCKLEENKKRFHGILGYEKFINLDVDVAKTCLLHTFPYNKLGPYQYYSNMFFNKREDYEFVASYMQSHPLTDADLLIQLADCLANKNGIVTIEDRMEEYVQRKHITPSKESYFIRLKIKEYFEQKIGKDIYTLLGLKT